MDRTQQRGLLEAVRRQPSGTWVALVSLTALGLCAAAALFTATSPFSANRGLMLAGQVLVIAAPVAAGLYGLRREPGNRFARLLVLAGLFWAPTMLAQSGDSLLYSTGRVWSWFVEPSLIYLVLAFPSGRLTTRPERLVFGASLVVLGLMYLPTAFLVDQYPVPNPWTGCTAHCPANAFMITGSEPGLIDGFLRPLREILTALLFLSVAGLLALRIERGSPLMRRSVTPVLLIAIFRMMVTVAFFASRKAGPGSTTTDTLGLVVLFATPALALGFAAGLVRARLFASNVVYRLSLGITPTVGAEGLRNLLAKSLEDPSLEIAYWTTHSPGRWSDEHGDRVDLPPEGSGRTLTEIADDGRPVAALIHDSALRQNPELIDAVGHMALMSLENQRLNADLGSSLQRLRESRARILSSADEERHRIERDLHDGAQQRLVALRIRLELAREQMTSDPARGKEILEEVGRDMGEALEEVQALARGVYPALLSERGLKEALEGVSRLSPVHVVVHAATIGRLSKPIETAVYFCCHEAIQNAVKHGEGAETVDITLAENGELRFEVRDDGKGFDPDNTNRGAGLVNMSDRLAAVGGSLGIRSAPGRGTSVVGTVPLG
jgi:signal transduction histidine kinase